MVKTETVDRPSRALRSSWTRLALAAGTALALLALPAQASAEGSEREPLFKKPMRVGGWGGPALRGTTIGKGAGLMAGAAGGLILGHRLLVGA